MTTSGYSSPSVCAITGVPPSTLNYWARTGVVVPSLRTSAGRRATLWWSLSDLVAVRSVKALRDAGCPLQTLRRIQTVIAETWSEDLGSSVLHWDGVDVIRVGPFGEVESLVRHPGQEVLHVMALPIGRWQADLAQQAEVVDIEKLRDNDRRRAQMSAAVRRSRRKLDLRLSPGATLRYGLSSWQSSSGA